MLYAPAIDCSAACWMRLKYPHVAMGAPGELSRTQVRRDATGRRARRCMVLRPAPFNFTELLDEGRNDTGLPPRHQYWIQATIGLG
jgi:hypothetical protein